MRAEKLPLITLLRALDGYSALNPVTERSLRLDREAI